MKFALRVLAPLLGLLGCMSVPLTSLVPLSRIDIGTTDLAVLRVAITLPEAVKPHAGAVVMDAVSTIDSEPAQKTAFRLIETDEAVYLLNVPAAAEPGFATYVYRLSDDALGRFDALRRTALQQHAAGKAASLGFGIATDEFCTLGPLPAGPLLTTTYLLTSETGRYVVVTDRVDLRAQPKVAPELAHLGRC